MKKVLLIGKFNELTKEVNKLLSSEYQVQLCSDNRGILGDMLQMISVDLIVLVVLGMYTTLEDTMPYLFSKCQGVPIIVIGKEEHRDTLSKKGYMSSWVRVLFRPIDPEELRESASALIKLKEGISDAEEEKEDEVKIPRVLLVDDNPEMLRAMASVLSERYKVAAVTSGPQAISAIAKKIPDIILLDYQMPVCDGKQTLEMLRSEPTTKDIPVVFLTGIAFSDYVEDVMHLHPEGYLLKPCREDRLFSTIERVLAKKAKNEKGK